MAPLGLTLAASIAIGVAQDCGDLDGCEDHVALLSSRHRISSRGSLEGCSTAEAVSFDDYMLKYDRDFVHGSAEYDLRKSLFEGRQEEVLQHNCRAEHPWSVVVNHLSDRTDEERNLLFGWKHQGGDAHASLLQERRGHVTDDDDASSTVTVRSMVNWNLTATTIAKDQGSCGSCWAVAAVNLLEAHWEIHNKDEIDPLQLSVQDFVDCVDNPNKCGGTGGCEGSIVELAMEYFLHNAMNTAKMNKYVHKDTNRDACNPKSGGFSALSMGLVGYRTLPSNEAEPVMIALQSGPVAVALEANSKWFHYHKGIVDGCKKANTVINHAVLLTGYGQEKKKNFWKILNSWGKNWGDHGSILITRQDTSKLEEEHCAEDKKPQDGIGCAGGPKEVTVCGTCGVLFDVVALDFSSTPALKLAENGDVEKM